MKHTWLILFVLTLQMQGVAATGQTGRVTSATVDPARITRLRLRPDFESIIHLPEEVTSVVVGSPSTFHVEHNEAEPNFVYVKPITRSAAHSDLLIAMKSGQHVVLELISDGDSGQTTEDVDFLLEYKPAHSFVILPVLPDRPPSSESDMSVRRDSGASTQPSAIDQELALQKRVNSPMWTRWAGHQLQTSLGDVRQVGNQTLIAYSVFNAGDHAVEIVPAQIQMDGVKPKKQGKNILSDQLEIRTWRSTTTRLEPGARADAVLLFDRPNFKGSTDTLFLQLAQADQVDHPILIKLPFTPPLLADAH